MTALVTVRTTRLGTTPPPTGRDPRPEPIDPALHANIRSLFVSGAAPVAVIAAVRDERGGVEVFSGLARNLLTFDGVTSVLFDDGYQAPLASITAFAVDIASRR